MFVFSFLLSSKPLISPRCFLFGFSKFKPHFDHQLVISPLISLAYDQLRHLSAAGGKEPLRHLKNSS